MLYHLLINVELARFVPGLFSRFCLVRFLNCVGAFLSIYWPECRPFLKLLFQASFVNENVSATEVFKWMSMSKHRGGGGLGGRPDEYFK